jgi:hypothetical protein
MIDQILANPCISQNELAAVFGYTASWVSLVMASDAFKARLAEKSKDLIDPILRATVEERFKGLVLRSLEILQEKLNRPPKDVPDQLALRTFELSSRAAGYGVKDPNPAQTPGDLHIHLEAMGEQLTGLLRRKRAEIIDAVPLEVKPA